jgi:maleate isomerase
MIQDLLGYRRLLGLLAPASNTVALADASRINLTGVVAHQSDYREPVQADDTDAFLRAVDEALGRMDCKAPVEIGLIADEEFIGKGALALGGIAKLLGRPDMLVPSNALSDAVKAFGPRPRLGLISPYPVTLHKLALERLRALDMLVVADTTLACASLRDAARVSYVRMRELYEEVVAQSEVDVIVQLGHNLPFARLVDNLEEDFGRPVLAINTVCSWKLLRRGGILDPVPGAGLLMLEH